LCLRREDSGVCDDSGAPYRFTMCPTGANITTMRRSRFSATRGTCSSRLTLFVFAMNMVLPPLDTENSEKNPGADELCRNSTEKLAADERGHKRNCCGNQRRAHIASRIFPMEYPPERHVPHNASHDGLKETNEG